jgi:hypothetical protein
MVAHIRLLTSHIRLLTSLSLSAPDAFTLSRYVFNHKDQRVLAQALHELYGKRKAMLVNLPPQQQQQQQQPQPPQQVLQCPRMTAYVKYCQEQQRRRETGAWQDICWQDLVSPASTHVSTVRCSLQTGVVQCAASVGDGWRGW